MPTAPARARRSSGQALAHAAGDRLDASAASPSPNCARSPRACRRCPLWRNATQTVFGEGAKEARRSSSSASSPVIRRTAPASRSSGRPGNSSTSALVKVGIDRSTKTYVTNAVKHFKFEPHSKRRIHSKPNAREIQACKPLARRRDAGHQARPSSSPWAPRLPRALMGNAFRVTKMRGQTVEREDGLKVFITIHPSFILRIREPHDKAAERARFPRRI